MDSQRWWRIAIFCLITGGTIWWLFSRAVPEEEGATSSRVKSDFIEKGEISSGVIDVVGEKVNQLLPDPVKEQISKIENQLMKKSTQMIEETEVVNQVKTTIQQALEEVDDFPEKQKKEIKREVIRQVCNDLLEEVEE